MIEGMVGRIASPEVIGREAELALIEAGLAEALAHRSRTVLIGGEAGIGKSRLLEEAMTRARAAGATVLLGGCIGLAEGALPFAPIVEAIRPLVRDLEQDGDAAGDPSRHAERVALEAVAGELGLAAGRRASPTAAAELRPEWARSRAYEAVLDLLRRMGERRPVVLAVEDLHWADDSTRELLAFLVRNAQEERVLLLVTFRSDELHRRHPLLPWLAEVDRSTRV
jgi:predicted ATPase